MNSPMAVTVGWALEPTRIEGTTNRTGNSPTNSDNPNQKASTQEAFAFI
jgi:hypothetical protein